jgi:predicted AAA+ superfamily ATPase
MVHRSYWIDRIEAAWRRTSIVWLYGVRRVGKTCLTKSLADCEYFDCELPSVRRMIEDPEDFLRSLSGRRVVLDEIHRLANPSEVLKIAADHHPEVPIVATGSSTLQASAKFRDTLTGRKEDVWLTPMVAKDLDEFGDQDIRHRLKTGGLPPFFMGDEEHPSAYQTWMDGYWAKDVQVLFGLERQQAFQRLVELLMIDSGGLFEATRYAAPCEISRQTVTNYVTALEATRVATLVRPFSSRKSSEIVSAPKLYMFDTGFVAFFKGWTELQDDEYGRLWEHFVLNEMQARRPTTSVRHWRNKHGLEVDFVVAPRGGDPVAVEVKWSAASALDGAAFASFRRLYPSGDNFVVARDVARPFSRTIAGLRITWVGLEDLIAALP